MPQKRFVFAFIDEHIHNTLIINNKSLRRHLLDLKILLSFVSILQDFCKTFKCGNKCLYKDF